MLSDNIRNLVEFSDGKHDCRFPFPYRAARPGTFPGRALCIFSDGRPSAATSAGSAKQLLDPASDTRPFLRRKDKAPGPAGVWPHRTFSFLLPAFGRFAAFRQKSAYEVNYIQPPSGIQAAGRQFSPCLQRIVVIAQRQARPGSVVRQNERRFGLKRPGPCGILLKIAFDFAASKSLTLTPL